MLHLTRKMLLHEGSETTVQNVNNAILRCAKECQRCRRKHEESSTGNCFESAGLSDEDEATVWVDVQRGYFRRILRLHEFLSFITSSLPEV